MYKKWTVINYRIRMWFMLLVLISEYFGSCCTVDTQLSKNKQSRRRLQRGNVYVLMFRDVLLPPIRPGPFVLCNNNQLMTQEPTPTTLKKKKKKKKKDSTWNINGSWLVVPAGRLIATTHTPSPLPFYHFTIFSSDGLVDYPSIGWFYSV